MEKRDLVENVILTVGLTVYCLFQFSTMDISEFLILRPNSVQTLLTFGIFGRTWNHGKIPKIVSDLLYIIIHSNKKKKVEIEGTETVRRKFCEVV